MQRALQEGLDDSTKEEMMKVLITAQQLGLYQSDIVASYNHMINSPRSQEQDTSLYDEDEQQ
jgi:hypothetical protein